MDIFFSILAVFTIAMLGFFPQFRKAFLISIGAVSGVFATIMIIVFIFGVNDAMTEHNPVVDNRTLGDIFNDHRTSDNTLPN